MPAKSDSWHSFMDQFLDAAETKPSSEPTLICLPISDAQRRRSKWIEVVKSFPHSSIGGADYSNWLEICQHISIHGPAFEANVDLECMLRCILFAANIRQHHGHTSQHNVAILSGWLQEDLDPTGRHWSSATQFAAWIDQHTIIRSWTDVFKSMGVHQMLATGTAPTKRTTFLHAWNTLQDSISRGNLRCDPGPPNHQHLSALMHGNNPTRFYNRAIMMLNLAEPSAVCMVDRNRARITGYATVALEACFWGIAVKDLQRPVHSFSAIARDQIGRSMRQWTSTLRAVSGDVYQRWLRIISAEQNRPGVLLTNPPIGCRQYEADLHADLVFVFSMVQRMSTASTPSNKSTVSRLMFTTFCYFLEYSTGSHTGFPQRVLAKREQMQYSVMVLQLSTLTTWWQVCAGADELEDYKPPTKLKTHSRLLWVPKVVLLIKRVLAFYGDAGHDLVRNTLLRDLQVIGNKPWIKDVENALADVRERTKWQSVLETLHLPTDTSQNIVQVAWPLYVVRVRHGSTLTMAGCVDQDNWFSSVLMRVQLESARQHMLSRFGVHVAKDLISWSLVDECRHLFGAEHFSWATQHIRALLPPKSWPDLLQKVSPKAAIQWVTIQSHYADVGPIIGTMAATELLWVDLLNTVKAIYGPHLAATIVDNYVRPVLLKLFDVRGIYREFKMWSIWLSNSLKLAQYPIL